MPSRVAVVTDSTASLPARLAERFGIITVPMQLKIGPDLLDDGTVRTDRLVAAMQEQVPVEPQPPAPDAFFWAYQDAWARGAETIVSLHVTERLSPAAEAAKQAAARSRVPVFVVDTQSAGMTLGFAAVAAARIAQSGGTAENARSIAEERSRASTVLIYVDTLHYLRKAGRVSATAKLLGDTLSVKPLLTVSQGVITPVDKAFGKDRALAKLVDRAVALAYGRDVDLAVEHFAAEQDGHQLLEMLRKRIPHARDVVLTQVSAALGANIGPGALTVTVSPY
ncbi:EDD domain protein, DegV family [Lentzea fradiae]|uniref:EDD domain protein, DegV family n=1 Tax=Lentzea fradiae TaxID=200378 RepID=A0A1G7TS58_9PSEU|nr:DegV family protein [Lentzea fradiae]SDG37794.1 EDD domain protein, DegV family [Lentzea fradiae]